MSNKSTNYWTWSDSELMAELDRRQVPYEKDQKFMRKDLVNSLKKSDVMLGHATEIHVEEENPEDDINPKAIEGLAVCKKEVPHLVVSRVIFHNSSETDLPYVYVGHNGTSFYIPKDMEVDVPDYILDSCIKDAVEDRLYPYQNQDGSIDWRIKRVPRFPYTVVKKSFAAL